MDAVPRRIMKQKNRVKRIAQLLTSIFENGTTEIQYSYVEDLNDGRGITCGRSGFCTGTGDAYEVVKRYSRVRSDNPLAKYLPELRRLNTADDRSDTTGLAGFSDAWAQCAADNDFRQIQDDVTDDLYWRPSQRRADDLGLETPLARAFIFDTIIQHGDDEDPDGLGALVSRAALSAGGTRAEGVDEHLWLEAFIAARRADLAHCSDESSRAEWAGSVGRCDVFSRIAASGNYELRTPFAIKWEGEIHVIT